MLIEPPEARSPFKLKCMYSRPIHGNWKACSCRWLTFPCHRGSVTHTRTPGPDVYWKLAFNSPQYINNVVVWGRTDCCEVPALLTIICNADVIYQCFKWNTDQILSQTWIHHQIFNSMKPNFIHIVRIQELQKFTYNLKCMKFLLYKFVAWRPTIETVYSCK